MRINVYTEELLKGGEGSPVVAEVVTAEYVSSRTNLPMKNYGFRIFLASAPELHYIPPRDDDRSAVTFWCGDSLDKVFKFLDQMKACAEYSNMLQWRTKVSNAATEAEEAEAARK